MTADATEILAELAENADPRTRAVNERHGDDHGVKLTVVRAIAKRLKKNQELARELWATGDSAARLVALLIARPKDFTADDVDAMLRQARTPKVTDWLVGYIAMKSPYAEDLRVRWSADPESDVAAAGWSLTADRIATKRVDGLDLPGLLDVTAFSGR